MDVIGVEKINTETTSVTYTDKEFAQLMKISVVSFRNHAKHGPPRKRNPFGSSLDVREVKHFYLGIQRRWVAESVHDFISGTWGDND